MRSEDYQKFEYRPGRKVLVGLYFQQDAAFGRIILSVMKNIMEEAI
jgi:hypothetical protein